MLLTYLKRVLKIVHLCLYFSFWGLIFPLIFILAEMSSKYFASWCSAFSCIWGWQPEGQKNLLYPCGICLAFTWTKACVKDAFGYCTNWSEGRRKSDTWCVSAIPQKLLHASPSPSDPTSEPKTPHAPGSLIPWEGSMASHCSSYGSKGRPCPEPKKSLQSLVDYFQIGTRHHVWLMRTVKNCRKRETLKSWRKNHFALTYVKLWMSWGMVPQT